MYIECFGLGLLGMLFQIALKLKSLQDKANAANIVFKESDFFKNDKWTLICNILAILIFVFLIGDIAKLWPSLNGWIKIIFAFIGYIGSDVLLRFFGVVEKKMNGIIDIKTNQADGGSQNVTTIK